MYLHAYGKSVIEIATNTIAFVTEFLPLGVTNLRPAFTVSSWDFAATFGKINKAIKNYFVSRHEFCFNFGDNGAKL